MYFPIGWPHILSINEAYGQICHISASYDKLYFAILSEKALSIWYSKPSVEIVSFTLTDINIVENGNNLFCKWKFDSKYIAVVTNQDFIVFYQIIFPKSSNKIYKLKHNKFNGTSDDDNVYSSEIPFLSIVKSHCVHITGQINSIACFRDELMVATSTGLLERLTWQDGIINPELSIHLASLPFSTDLQYSRSSHISNSNVSISCLDYSPQMAGFAIVLSNGKAAFLGANSSKFEPNSVVGVWAQEMTEATCAAINHKYALLVFGDARGYGTVYQFEELSGALVVSHRLIISNKDFPDASEICGPVNLMRWTPDGSALVLAWLNGGLSVWSVFGSLLLQLISADSMVNSGYHLNQPFMKFFSLEWGSEGYNLWMIGAKTHIEPEFEGCPKDNDTEPAFVSGSKQNHVECPTFEKESNLENNNQSDGSAKDVDSNHVPSLMQLCFVKSALCANPCLSNQVHLLLQGEDRLYFNPEDGLGSDISASVNSSLSQPPSSIISNRQWHVMTLPTAYLANNWPIRFAAMSGNGYYVAVAGRFGLIHYALSSRTWKMFGNETQERDIIVTGGLTWWRDFICLACYNLLEQHDEMRFYPRDAKLDNTFAKIVRSHSPIILLNVFVDTIIILTADCHITLYNIARKNSQTTKNEITLQKLQDIDIRNFLPHPGNVIALTLASIRTDSAVTRKNRDSVVEAESILINVAGRLLLFQRDRSQTSTSEDKWLNFTAPVIVASCVENMWSSMRGANPAKPHLTDAFWLGCGVAGMKVWLPLQLREDVGKSKGFLSRRIMLPVAVDIYPLAMLLEAGIILGVNSESVSYQAKSNQLWPYFQLERTSQVYLHHILRQLLRRNLGTHSLEIARSCKDLLYFPHVLELLVHEVLEEEATSKEPIPDALLPRVVAFIEEFPEHLQTIAHCARKSDVAVWPYFFSVVGRPVDLFQECISTCKWYTAASYLIILQNLEKAALAKQYATLLLDMALDNSVWDLARDLVRFLSTIESDEKDCETTTTRRVRQNSQSVYPAFFSSNSNASEELEGYMGHAGVTRVRSLSKEEGVSKVVKENKGKTIMRSESIQGKSRIGLTGLKDADTVSDKLMSIDAVLDRHARKLLSCHRLYDLAKFAANLHDYHLVSWLCKERHYSARIEDYIGALKKLHIDFKWPYRTFTRLSSITSLCSDPGLRPSLDEGINSSINSSNLDPHDHNINLTNHKQMIGHNDPSECSSVQAGELDSLDSNSDFTLPTDIDLLARELCAQKGPMESDIQLRYLFQLLMEGGCIQWASLVAIVLTDVALMLRVINEACLIDTPAEDVVRLRDSLAKFEEWTNNESIGYKSFLISIQDHYSILKNIDISQHPSVTTKVAPLRSSLVPSPLPSPPTLPNDSSNSLTALKLVEKIETAQTVVSRTLPIENSVKLGLSDEANVSSSGCIIS